MGIRLDDEARRYLAAFGEKTAVTATDCLVTESAVVFVVPPAGMADAIGPDGRTVRALEDRLDREVVLVEDADRAADFVANALAPAAVYEVTVEERGDTTVAVATVDADDVGVAIGTDGIRIDRARRLAGRHFAIDDIELESTGS